MQAVSRTPLRALVDERNRLQAELDALQIKIRGLDLAIELITEEARKLDQQSRARGITDTIRDLLREAGTAGLSPQMAVEHAAVRGQKLRKSSVSSLLSRMKRDGEVAYKGRRYVLKATP